jgi:hypothetical protein
VRKIGYAGGFHVFSCKKNTMGKRPAKH